MWLPQENKEGYDAGNPMNHVGNLKGRLMLFFGSLDNNVHPSNTLQLARALQQAGKGFDVQVGPDEGHASLNYDRMMEFFMDYLGTVDQQPRLSLPADEEAESEDAAQEDEAEEEAEAEEAEEEEARETEESQEENAEGEDEDSEGEDSHEADSEEEEAEEEVDSESSEEDAGSEE